MRVTRTQKTPASVSILSGVAALAASAGAPVFAAGPPTVLEEVVVTATKRPEPILDVPLAVSAVTTADIQARGFSQYADFLNAVPGVYFQDSGPGTSQVRIRGISAAEGGVPSTTASYFGEATTSVLTNGGGKPNLRLVDIERVEVLKGPQGTLFGANSLAGVVRTIPNAPDPEGFEASLGTRGFATAHSDDASYHVEGVVNIPLIEHSLALRVVGYRDDIAGYIDNVSPAQPAVDYSAALGAPDGTLVVPATPAFTNHDINSEDTWGARAALSWRATDQLRFDLSYTTQDARLNSQPNATPSIGEYEQQRPLDVYKHGAQDERLNLTSAVINYDWDSATLLSASNWIRMHRFAEQDLSFLGVQAFGVNLPWSFNEQSVGQLFTQEIRLQSRGDSRVQWLGGLFLLRQKSDAGQFVADFSCPTCLPQVLAGQDFAYNFPLSRFSDQKQRSVFGEVSYDVATQWTVGAGGRYLRDELTASGGAQEGLLAGGSVPPQPVVGGTKSKFYPSTYVRFKPNSDMSLYVQAAQGFRSGQVNQLLPDTCKAEAQSIGLEQITDPDTLWNYELGFKARFADGRYTLRSAVFEQKWKGVQLIQSLTCGFSGVVNSGDVKGHGLEVELVAQPTDAWRFNLSAAYTRNRFDDVATGTGFENGERVPDAPENNGSVGAQYNFNLGGQWSSFIRADLVHVGNVLTKVGGSQIIEEDSFNLLNARLAFVKDTLSAELYGRNLTDERGVLTTNSNTPFGFNQTLTRPREVGVELRYSFR